MNGIKEFPTSKSQIQQQPLDAPLDAGERHEPVVRESRVLFQSGYCNSDNVPHESVN